MRDTLYISPHGKNKQRNRNILELYNATELSYTDIAKKVGVTRCVVAGVVHRAKELT